MTSSVAPAVADVVGDAPICIGDIVDREALDELCRGIHALFGIGVHVYSSEGALLANVATQLGICTLVNELADGRIACGKTVSAAKNVDPGSEGDTTHACFNGLAYRIVSLDYEGRRVGRIVLGPYAPAGFRTAPPSLVETVRRLDVVQANERLATVARVKPEALGRIARHLKTTLELIIFSSHKAYVTSKLHLYSVRSNYRALEEKTARLEQALSRLKELDRLRSTFLGTVSHELRTPLTSIIGYSEMLTSGIAGPLSPEQAEFVSTIHDKGEQLLALIMGLLDLSKLDSGTMSLRQGTVHIAAVLREVVSTLAPVAIKKEVDLVVQEGDAICEISGDAERLRQVFLNLVDNALKFTPTGGRVTVCARSSDAAAPGDDDAGFALLSPVRRAVTVTVADTGIGIASDERHKVFDAFYQIDSSSTRQYGGTGLGLSIVQRIVEAHGGTIEIQENAPAGTVFVVTLPSAMARRTLPSRVPPPLEHA